MRRIPVLMAVLALPAFLATGCSQQLSAEDRALLVQAQSDAKAAQVEAGKAAAAAQAAAADARAANEKAERMFSRAQRKTSM